MLLAEARALTTREREWLQCEANEGSVLPPQSEKQLAAQVRVIAGFQRKWGGTYIKLSKDADVAEYERRLGEQLQLRTRDETFSLDGIAAATDAVAVVGFPSGARPLGNPDRLHDANVTLAVWDYRDTSGANTAILKSEMGAGPTPSCTGCRKSIVGHFTNMPLPQSWLCMDCVLQQGLPPFSGDPTDGAAAEAWSIACRTWEGAIQASRNMRAANPFNKLKEAELALQQAERERDALDDDDEGMATAEANVEAAQRDAGDAKKRAELQRRNMSRGSHNFNPDMDLASRAAKLIKTDDAKARNDLAQLAFLLAIGDTEATKHLSGLHGEIYNGVDTVDDVYNRPEFTALPKAKSVSIGSQVKLAERISLFGSDGTKDRSVKAFVQRMNKVRRLSSRFRSRLTNAITHQISLLLCVCYRIGKHVPVATSLMTRLRRRSARGKLSAKGSQRSGSGRRTRRRRRVSTCTHASAGSCRATTGPSW